MCHILKMRNSSHFPLTPEALYLESPCSLLFTSSLWLFTHGNPRIADKCSRTDQCLEELASRRDRVDTPHTPNYTLPMQHLSWQAHQNTVKSRLSGKLHCVWRIYISTHPRTSKMWKWVTGPRRWPSGYPGESAPRPPSQGLSLIITQPTNPSLESDLTVTGKNMKFQVCDMFFFQKQSCNLKGQTKTQQLCVPSF